MESRVTEEAAIESLSESIVPISFLGLAAYMYRHRSGREAGNIGVELVLLF